MLLYARPCRRPRERKARNSGKRNTPEAHDDEVGLIHPKLVDPRRKHHLCTLGHFLGSLELDTHELDLIVDRDRKAIDDSFGANAWRGFLNVTSASDRYTYFVPRCDHYRAMQDRLALPCSPRTVAEVSSGPVLGLNHRLTRAWKPRPRPRAQCATQSTDSPWAYRHGTPRGTPISPPWP